MAFSYLTPENIYERYKDARQYTDSLTDPFPEFERLARNLPHPGIDKAYPKTTDGTTASIIRKTPRRVIQQLPTGVVKSGDPDDWLPIVAEFIYLNKIIPKANEDYDLIQKYWSAIEKSLTFGSCAVYTPFLDHEGYLCPDMSIPYWGDLALQRGKKSGYANKYTFLDSWWQKEDIEALISQETKRKKESKTYEPTWDTAALRSILTATETKDEKSQTPAERERRTEVTGGIKLTTGFQIGVGAKFYTFHSSTKQVVRTKVNKDPRGKMPIDWMYGDIDGSNPLGRGIVELVGPLQNLIDADMQMYQFNRALMLAPPIIKKGNYNKNKLVMAPNRIWDLGNDTNNTAEPATIDSTAIANYPALYGLQKSQLLNLTSSPDSSISAEIGNPGFSKTDSGVKQQNAIVSVDDNYVRKMSETFIQNWSETAINMYFAERTGIEELQLDDETAEKLNKLAQKGKFDPSLLSPDNKIRIDYDTATPALKFEVDASTTKMKDDTQQLQGLELLQTSLDKSPVLSQIVPPEKVIGVWNSLVAVSGVENPEDLKIDIKEFQQKQQPQQPVEPPKPVVVYRDAPEDVKRQMEAKDGYQPSQGLSPVTQELQLKAKQISDQAVQAERSANQADRSAEMTHENNQANLKVKSEQSGAKVPTKKPAKPKQIPAPEEPQQGITEQDQQLIDQLKQLGVPEDAIGRALAMLHHGMPVEQILQTLGLSNG